MIYINRNLSRDSYMASKIISKQNNQKIAYFYLEDIYTLIDKEENIIIIDEHNFQNPHLQNLLSHAKDSNHKFKCKIYLIGHDENIGIDNIISVNEYVLLDSLYEFSNVTGQEFIFAEISNITKEVSAKLKKLLYPANKRIPVKMVNNPEFIHYQNLGTCREEDVMTLIDQCSYFINVNNKYLYDAINCGKKVVDLVNTNVDVQISDIDSVILNNDLYKETIKNKSLSKILGDII